MLTGRFCRRYAAFAVAFATQLAFSTVEADAQSQQTRAARANQPSLHSDVNEITETDRAASRFIDSLFDIEAPNSPIPEVVGQMFGRLGYKGAARRSTLRGRLVRNPHSDDGSPPFVLVDRYGGIQRYIEPISNVDLESHEGEIVGVRRDTGDTLLASQLDLPRTRRQGEGVRLADFQESIGPGEVLQEEDAPLILPEGVDPVYLDDGLDFGGYPDYEQQAYSSGGYAPGGRGTLYARGEYLLWWTDGMYIPRLVVRGDDDGLGNFTNATIAYGDQDILEDSRNGGRILLGLWLDDDGRWAVEGDYFGFNQLSSRFVDGGDGVTPPFVGRPFIDATTGLDVVEDVSFPGIQGTVTIDATSDFQSAGLRLRHNLFSTQGCTTSCGDCVSCGTDVSCGDVVGGCDFGIGKFGALGTRRMDMLLGVRYAQLEEGLGITEDLTTIETVPTTILLNDGFATSNEFVGGEVGFVWEWEHRRWSLELLSKLAIGNTRQRVFINGSTTRDTGVGPETKVGGLLAQSTNIGRYTRNELSIIPEIGATVGFALTQRLRITAGYTFLYWSRVARPGDQIDLEVNPSLLTFPPAANPNPARPQFVFRDTDFWAQGINLGADYRW